MDKKSDDKLYEVFTYFRLIFAEDVRFKIINLLASREGANLREIARRVGISHTNCSRYLNTLVGKGVIDVFPVGQGRNVYRLSPNYTLLRQFSNNHHYNGKCDNNHRLNNLNNNGINNRSLHLAQ